MKRTNKNPIASTGGKEYGELTSFLNEGLIFKNSLITGCGHLKISSLIEGDIEIEGDVYVNFAGVVKGNIICSNLTVEGSVTGEFVNAAQGVSIVKGGRVTANITCTRLNILDSSVFNGACNMRSGKESIVDLRRIESDSEPADLSPEVY
jgi:cytoskeletal protein CcmA (bactofilin family)